MSKLFFSTLGFIVKRRMLFFSLHALIFAISLLAAMKLQTDYNLNGFFPPEHPLLLKTKELTQKYYLEEKSPLILLISQSAGPWQSFTGTPTEFTQSLDDIELISKVRSFKSFKWPIVTQSEIAVQSLDQIYDPQSAVAGDSWLVPRFINSSREFLALYLDLNPFSGEELEKLKTDILERAQKLNVQVQFGGVPVMREEVSQSLKEELTRTFVISLGLSLLVVFLFFRNFSMVFVSFVCVTVSLINSIGFLVLLGYKFTILTASLPIMVSMVVLATLVHNSIRLSERRLRKQKLTWSEEVVQEQSDLFYANALSSATTIVGFMAFLPSASKVVNQYGAMISIGIAVAYVTVSLLLPLLQSVLPPPQAREFVGMRSRFALWQLQFSKTVFVIFGALAIFGAYAVTQLKWSSQMFALLPAKLESVKTALHLDSKLGGTLEIQSELVLGESWLTPENLNKLERVRLQLLKLSSVQSVGSLDQFFVKVQGQKDSESLPVRDLATLFSLSPENPLRYFLDSNERGTRFSFFLKDISTPELVETIKKFEEIVAQEIPQAALSIAGSSLEFHFINEELSKELVHGVWLSFAFMLALILFYFRSLKWTLICAIPNFIPPLGMYLILVIGHYSVEPTLALVFSIALGLAFNNTIYLAERYLVELKNWSSVKALRRAVWYETGSCFFSTLILILGFMIYFTSDFSINRTFGVFMIFAMLLGLAADLILFPHVLKWKASRDHKLVSPRAI